MLLFCFQVDEQQSVPKSIDDDSIKYSDIYKRLAAENEKLHNFKVDLLQELLVRFGRH